MGQRRFEEAGNHYLVELPDELTPVSQLDPVAQRAALNAAVCFERCGRVDRAAALFANLGKLRRAMDLLKGAGRRDDAALVQRGRSFPGAPWPPGALSRRLPEETSASDQRVEIADDLWRAPLPTAEQSTADSEMSSGSWELRSDAEEEDLARQLAQRSAEIGLDPVKVGAVINGRFRIEGPIGEGGFAIVFRGLDLALQEPVAIKLFSHSRRDETAVARMKEEVRIARRLAHPNIVDTYAFGTWGHACYITMELMRGQDLRAWTGRCGGTLPLPLAIPLLIQAFDGLEHAHRKGIVHRDVKPQNLFVVDRGRTLKVMDFGIARAAASARLTRTGRIVGTPAYISPERLKRGFRDLSPAADLYSMGVVLYRTLTGLLPFDEPDVALLFREIMQKVPLPPSAVKPGLPGAMDEIVMKLLEKDPADRYQSCGEVKRALIRVGVEG